MGEVIGFDNFDIFAENNRIVTTTTKNNQRELGSGRQLLFDGKGKQKEIEKYLFKHYSSPKT